MEGVEGVEGGREGVEGGWMGRDNFNALRNDARGQHFNLEKNTEKRCILPFQTYFIHTYIHTHIHKYLHAYIHTLLDTYIHTCLFVYVCW